MRDAAVHGFQGHSARSSSPRAGLEINAAFSASHAVPATARGGTKAPKTVPCQSGLQQERLVVLRRERRQREWRPGHLHLLLLLRHRRVVRRQPCRVQRRLGLRLVPPARHQAGGVRMRAGRCGDARLKSSVLGCRPCRAQGLVSVDGLVRIAPNPNREITEALALVVEVALLTPHVPCATDGGSA